MKAANYKVFISLLLTIISISGYSQNYIWAKAGVGDGQSRYSYLFDYKIATDQNGNVYTTGSFNNKIQFQTNTLTADVNDPDIIIAKYDITGNLKWIIQDGGNSSVLSRCICYDNGFIYVAGEFNGTAIFGNDTLVVPFSSGTSAFIIKYDTLGNFIWSRKISTDNGGHCSINIYTIKADENGDLILGGNKYYPYTIYFDTIAISERGCFIAKYNSNGRALWVSIGTSPHPYAKILSAIPDHAGNCYSTGVFYDDVTFGNTTISSHAYTGVFLIKHNSFGSFLWAKNLGGDYTNGLGYDLDVDSLNNVYISGKLTDSSHYMSGYNFMLSKCDSAGNVIWIKNSKGADCRAISLDNTGNVYFVGNLYEKLILNNDTLDSSRPSILVGKLDSSGNTVWLSSNCTSQGDMAGDIAVLNNGKCYISGGFSPIARFNQDVLVGIKNQTSFFVSMFIDSTFSSKHNNIIRGNVYNDLNFNCLRDTNELGIEGMIIIAQPGNYYAVTDCSGNYILNVDSAIYTVSQNPPDLHLFNASQICPVSNGSYTVNALNSNTIMTGYNFADNFSACPLLFVCFGEENILQCYQNTETTINIFNYGSVSSPFTQVKMKFEKPIVPVSSIPAWTSYIPGDTTLIYNLDTLPPGGQRKISIVNYADCFYMHWFQNPFVKTVSIEPFNSCLTSDTILCVDTLTEIVIWGGINELSDDKPLLVYPNPGNGLFTFNGFEHDDLIQFFDVTGRLIFQIMTKDHIQTFDLTKKEKGIYIYRVTNKGIEVQNGKVLLQ